MIETTTQLRGVIHGRTIELDDATSLPEGQEVCLNVEPAIGPQMSTEDMLAAIDATAGACADEAEELEEFDRNTRNLRHMGQRDLGYFEHHE